MRVLRVRRGFTTNSSGGNEWVPGSTTAAGHVRTDTATRAPVREGRGGGEGRAAEAAQAASALGPPPARNVARENATMVGVLGGVVLTAFVTGSVVRALAKKRRRAAEGAEDAAGGEGGAR